MTRQKLTQGIYLIANWSERKCYVGSSKYIEDRLNGHRSQLRRGKHHSKRLQEDWNRLGESAFQFLKWEEVSNIAELGARERFWIGKFEGHKHYNSGVPCDRIFPGYFEASSITTKKGKIKTGDVINYRGKKQKIKSFSISKSRFSAGRVVVFFQHSNVSVGGSLKRLIETPEKFLGRKP